jgi:ApaLI-like restriction endonuclease
MRKWIITDIKRFSLWAKNSHSVYPSSPLPLPHAHAMKIKETIQKLADRYASELKRKVDARVTAMDDDDRSHVLIYAVLGVSENEGKLIDVYQNKGRLLYNSAGRFLEAATKLCFKQAFPDSKSVKLPNTRGKPHTVEIDCLVGNDALEIKWRDATTDGDHINKEHARIQIIREAGYTPIRIMFFYPNREQAMKTQATLKTLYKGVAGEYHYADAAWAYVKQRTRVDLLGILKDLAAERTKQNGK